MEKLKIISGTYTLVVEGSVTIELQEESVPPLPDKPPPPPTTSDHVVLSIGDGMLVIGIDTYLALGA